MNIKYRKIRDETSSAMQASIPDTIRSNQSPDIELPSCTHSLPSHWLSTLNDSEKKRKTGHINV